MKIWYLHQYFRTPEEGGATRSYTLAQGLAQAGHQVHVVTAHNQTEYLRRQISPHLVVHYLPVAYRQAMGMATRGKAFTGYVRAVLQWAAQQSATPDGIYATSTPLTVGYLAYRLHRRYQIPYVFEVRDLWPDVPFQLAPALRLMSPGLRYWERRIYRHARGIVALSPPMATAIQKRTQTPTTVIPNFADRTLFRPEAPGPAWRERWQVPEGKLCIAYTGSIGLANAPSTLVAAVVASPTVHWVILGEGSHWAAVKAALLDAPNVSFHPFDTKAEVADLLNSADAAWVSFLEKPQVLGTNSPNKFFEALASGCAVLTNRPGWYTDLIEDAGAGTGVTPEGLPVLLQQWAENPQRLKENQSAARTLSEQFDANLLTQKWLAWVLPHFKG